MPYLEEPALIATPDPRVSNPQRRMLVLCPLEHIHAAQTARTVCCPAAMFSPTKAEGYPNFLVILVAALVLSAELCEKKFLVAISVEWDLAAVPRMLAPDPVRTRGCLFGDKALFLHEE
jgi:hypothetical protein